MDGKRETYNAPRQQIRSLRSPVVSANTTTHGRSSRYRRDKDSDENRGPPNAVLTAHVAQTSATEEDTEMHGVQDQWELVENETPPYIRAQQAQARQEAGVPTQVNASDAIHGGPFVFVGPNGPTDITDNAGNRVRVYEHTSTRHITFAPGAVPPRPRAPGTPMFEPSRRPTPFPPPPLRPFRAAGAPDFEVERPPTPFPYLDSKALDPSKMPSQQDIEFQQRAAQRNRQYRAVQVESTGWNVVSARHQVQATQRCGTDFQQHGTPQPYGNARQPPPTRALDTPVAGRHPPLGWRTIGLNERHMPIEDYDAVPWEDRTPYISAAHDRHRGIDNPLRPTKPTWEQEDDSDEEPRHAKPNPLRVPEYPEEEYGDDEASMRQNRPEDYQHRPHGRRALRVLNPDLDDACVGTLEQRAKPSITRSAHVNQAPLYGKMVFNNDLHRLNFVPTHGFHEWLRDAANARDARDDFFHEWLRAKEAESAKKPILPGNRNFDMPMGNKIAPAKPSTGLTDNCSPLSQKNEVKDGKRGADSPVDERPSKRSRLASTFRRKLSMSGTAMGTANGSGDTSNSSTKRRASGLDIFNVRSFSSLRTGLSRASSVGPKRVRIAIVGDSSAGKTTLLNRLYTGMYQPAEKSVHYRNNDFPMSIDGHPVVLEAWDIPGELPADETHPLNRSFFDAALICFSVDNVQNVDKASHWVTVLQSCLVVDVPLYLVGLKSDARPSFPKLRLPFMNEATPSSREQCENTARKVGAVEYFECSAKTGEGVNDMFNTVIQHARSKKDEEELKRASRLRKEKFRRGMQDTGRRISNVFRGKDKHA